MKNTFLFVVLTLLLIACQKDESAICPGKLVYQRWHFSQTKRIGDNAWIMPNTDGYYDTEYRPDGTLIHRKDGVVIQANCCQPIRFNRSGKTINYTDRDCPFTLCVADENQATITQLGNNLLELNDGTYISQYTAVR